VLVVVASDNGNPRLSSSATVRITVQDINDNEPVFEKTFYNVSLKENESDNLCFLKVVATDPDCGINSQVSQMQTGLSNTVKICRHRHSKVKHIASNLSLEQKYTFCTVWES
jgi:hypothetical protein